MTMYSWMIGALIVGLLFLVLLLYWLWRRKGVASGGAPAVPRVRGVAVDRFGKLLPGLIVQVFDRDIGDRRISLGSTTTDAKGAFEIKFSAPGSPSGGAGSRRASADLVFALAVEGQPIADFDIIRIPVDGDTLVSAEYVVSPEELALGLVARIDEWIRIVANGFALPAGVAKYDRLVAALAPLTKRTPLESFDEAKSRDISFAARAIGAPFAEVNDMVTAHKLVHGDLQEVDAAAVFALVDQWGANEPRHLAQRSITEISAALRHAAEASTIAALEDPIATATLIQRAAIRAALSPTGSGSAASLDSILVDVLPEAEARETLLSAAINHAGTADEFWREYEENHPSAPVAELKYTFQLGVLTNNNARLVNALKRAAPTATSLRGLALAVDSARIEELLQGEEELSSGEAHIVAGQVAGLLEAAHPTAAVARSALRWSRQDPDAVGKAAAVLLNKAVVETDFDIMRDDIGDYLQSERGRRFAETSSTEAQSDAVEGIRRIVRLFNVSTDPLILDHLALKRMNGGVLLRGGMDIAQYGKPAFLLNFPEASDAERHMLSYLHDRARAMTDTVATLLIGQHQDNNDVAPLAAVGKLGGVASTEEARASDGGTPIASWSDLFGGAEMCDCDDCRSVVGPAAYLVDLFEFLDKRCAANPTTWATPLDVLIGHPGKPAMRGATPGIRGKRPDLAHIKLTCENTNTTIPTIDLINEILETLVACDTDAPALPFESSPGITGPELSAGPEHVLPAAYEKVGGAVYPISLPYDRLVATARAYLQQAGTSRAEIIRLFSEASATKSKAAGHAETLGLFRRDYEILTGFTFGGAAVTPQISVASLYGFPGPSSGWSAEISVSRRLLQALQITFEELVTLLRTRYVGGEVPTGQPAELASRIFLTVDQLKALRAANFVVVPGSEIEDALALGGLTPTELSEYVEERLPRLSSTIVLNPPIGCSPDDITLRYLDGGYLDSDEIWLKLHRFVRLARRMKATFAELDAALFAVAGDVAPVFTRPLLGDLASLGDLRKRLALSWPVAASLVADIDTYGSASLYDELFIASGLARVSPVFRKGVGGVFEDDLDIEQGLSALAAAFNADLDDLVSIARDLGLTKLTLGTVSAVHRVLTLARTLSIEPREFLAMAGAIEAPDLADPSALSPDAVAGLVIRVQTLRSSGLTSSTIKFVKGESSEVGHTDPELDEILAALDETLKPLWERDDREAGDAAQTPDVDHVTEGEQRRRAAALPVLIKAFGVDDRIGRRLLDDQVDDGVARAALLRYQAGPAIALLAGRRQTPEERAAAARLLRGLDRIASLAKSMAIDAATFELTVTAGMLSKRVVDDLLDRPASGIVAAMLDEFADLVNLRNEVKRTDKLVTAVTAIATGGLSDAATAAVGALLGASEEAVRAVPIGKVKELDEPVVRRRPVAAIRALAVRIRQLRRIGGRAKVARALTAEPISGETLSELLQGVSANYGVSTWLDVSRQIADPIRQESRDALVAYLLHREGLRNQEELFDRFYIDVGTNAFVLTSRIRQAMLAVQIFVQRCLMGLERQSGVEPHQIDIEEWKIISRHAVWAARGKALLYPEELLNPAWRDNKSPAFKSFEAALQQGDVTPANAELGYRAYLDAFTAVASLEVCGTYLQEVFEGREQAYFKSVLHVIARSRGGANRSFFYRRLNRYEHHQEWTSWEAVDLDIQSVEPDRQEAKTDRSPPLAEAGVHVLPVVFRGQLYLFWPVFVRKIDQLADEPTLREGGTARFSKPYWEIKIAWSRKSEAGWSPKQQSGALFETWWWWPELQPPIWDDPSSYSIYVIGSPDGPKFPEPAEFVLKAIDKGQSLEIAVGHRTGPWGPTWRGTFSFSSSTSELKFVKNGGELGGDHFTVKAPQASPSFMGFRAKGEMRFVSTYRNRDGDVLMSPPNEIRVVTLNQVYGGMFAAPMFFDVGERSYFARSSLGANTIYDVISEPQVKPGLIDVQVWDPTVTGSILASEKRERHPWVIASKVNAAPYVGALIQSAANLAIKTWPSHLEPVGERSLTLTAQQPDPMIEVLLPMPLPFPYLFPFQTFKVKALNVDVLPFHHPFADLFSEVLRRDGLQALLSPDMQKLTLAHDKIFKSMAKPNPKRMGAPAREGVDFDQSSAYGNYNWELFFHAPAMLAQKLSDNAQYEAAIDLIRKAIYTPFAGTAEECWRFQGLRNEAAISLETMLQYLSLPDSNPLKQNVLAQIDMTRLHPFQAHRVARLRPLAYKKWIVAFDVRQHLAMGDAFFRRFTPEDVNQAIQYYMIAHRQMGPKPEVIKQRATLPARSYAELRPDLDAMGNVMFAAESKLSGFAGSTAGGADATSAGLVQRGSIGYFGIPKNEKLLGLWDEVADRLFKIRNGMNIDGVQIQLPLFSPPIDPALLAEAAAAGVDLANLAADLTKPLPNQRYQVLYHRAIEYAETVLRLGDALLAARERQEGESLQARRAANERDMATFLVDTRKRALDEATANRNYIAGEEETWKQRWMHYANLLGIPLTPSLFFAPFTTIPARKLSLVDADKISFEALSVVPDFAKVGLFLGSPVVGIGAALSDTTVAGVRQLSTGTVLQEEKQELESAFSAVKKTFDAAALDSLASVLGIIPNFEAAVKPLGAGAAVHLGGQFFALAASATARHKRAGGDMHNFVASVYRKQADLVLRERGWVLELNSAANEVQQARRRLAVADIQVDLAQRAVDAQSKDLDHATSIETLLRDKFTTAELYDWAEGRLRQLYKQCFEMALESAKMAEACYRFEREEENSTFIRVAPPANAREELVAGYELLAGLRNMNNAYGAAPRLSEFTRNVSLRQADPYALEDIRNGGTAEFTIPELIFQIDHPSYYDRRIKTVEVTIPCVAGPNSPVTGTLTLQKSRRRRQPKLDGEVRETVSGASIPLSSGRSDNGLFVLSMDDPLYLPFEGMGIDTDWKLELPAAVRHFDYRSIADVVLTIRYTAKRGGGSFPAMVSGSLKTALNTLKVNANAVAGPYQLFSLRHDLPTAWHALKAGNGLAIVLTNDMLPFMLQNLSPKLEAVEGVIRLKSGGSPPLSFSAPVSVEPGPSGAPAWKLPLPPNAPPELQNATEITDITLFARYSIDD